jgi:hypothetical protein
VTIPEEILGCSLLFCQPLVLVGLDRALAQKDEILNVPGLPATMNPVEAL